MKGGKRLISWILFGTLSLGLGACAPHFRRSLQSKVLTPLAQFSYSWITTRRAGSQGIAAAEQGLSFFPRGFPKATFPFSTMTHRPTVVGLPRQGSRYPDLFQYDMSGTTSALRSGFGNFTDGIQLEDQMPLTLFQSAYHEVLDVEPDLGGTFLYVLLRRDGNCHLLRYSQATGARDLTYTVPIDGCYPPSGKRAVIAMDTGGDRLAIVSGTETAWRVSLRVRSTGEAITDTINAPNGDIGLPPPTGLSSPSDFDIVDALFDGSDLVIAGTLLSNGDRRLSLMKMASDYTIIPSYGTSGYVNSASSVHAEGYDLIRATVSGVASYFIGGSINNQAALFRVDAATGVGAFTGIFTSATFSIAGSSVGAILQLQQDLTTTSLIHALGWRPNLDGASRPFLARFTEDSDLNRTLIFEPTIGTGVFFPAGAGFATATSPEFPLAFRVEGISGGGNPADRRIRFVSVEAAVGENAKFETYVADTTVAAGSTLVSTGARSDNTHNLHQNVQKSVPIGQMVDAQGRVLQIARVVISGAVTNSFSPIDPTDREISKIEMTRLLSNGNPDVSFTKVEVDMDGEGQCRSENMGFASDSVSGRFFVSCVKKSTATGRSLERAILVLGFDSLGNPLPGFGASGATVSEPCPLANLDPQLNLPLTVIPSCSPLLGGTCAGPGVAVGRTFEDGLGNHWSYVTVLDPLGAPVSTFGSFGALGTARPTTVSARVAALAYVPRLPENPSLTGLYVGLGNNQVVLLKSMGTVAEPIPVTGSVSSPDVLSIAVDPASGNAVTTHVGEVGGRVGWLNGALKTLTLLPLSAQVPGSPPGGSWLEWLGSAHYHPSGAFFVGQTILELNLINALNFQEGVVTRLLRIDLQGQVSHWTILPMTANSLNLPFQWSSGPSGELQLSFYTADRLAGQIQESARVVGVPGLKP